MIVVCYAEMLLFVVLYSINKRYDCSLLCFLPVIIDILKEMVHLYWLNFLLEVLAQSLHEYRFVYSQLCTEAQKKRNTFRF